MKRPMIALAFLALTGFLAAAQETSDQPEPPKSQPAKKAQAKYEDEMEKLEQEYAKRRGDLLKQYVKDLDDARKEALGKEQLDEAQRIVTLKKFLEEDGGKEQAPKPVPARGLHIVQAMYGTGPAWKDVSRDIRSQVRNSKVNLGDTTLRDVHFADPAPNSIKALVVAYTLNGKPGLAIIGEDQRIEIPPPARRR